MLKKFLLAVPVLAALTAGSALAQDSNQQIATAVARKISSSGKLNQYQLDIVVDGGKVELHGMVNDAAQQSEALRLAQEVAGANVISKLSVRGMIRQSAAQEPIPSPAPAQQPSPWAANEPIPSFAAGGGGPGFQQPAPPLPPYAWPTYAPYNNFSRVGHPTCYPADAMPFIGPFNPFPRAPLGWRNAQLSFDDGIWYLSSHSGNRDWWTVRFW
jgi:hypothetical protein